MSLAIDPRILNLRPSDPEKVARLVSSTPPPVAADHDIEDFLDFPESLEVKHQTNIGACNGFAASSGLEFSRDGQGYPHVRLSPWWVYGKLVGGWDVGSNIMDALALCSRDGVAPDSTVPQRDFSGVYSSTAVSEARRYRIQVGYALGRNWSAILTAVARRRAVNMSVRADGGWLVGRGSLDANGCPPVCPGPANHAIMAGGGIKTLPNGERAILCLNSWGVDWGLRGFFWLRKAHVETATWMEAYTIGAASSDPMDRLPAAIA